MDEDKKALWKKVREVGQKAGVLLLLSADFGDETSSPIPAHQPTHHNTAGMVPAVPGLSVALFPGKRLEWVEFGSYIRDEHGRPCGIHCRIKNYPDELEKAGLPPSPVQELALMVGEPEHFSDSSFERGVTIYVYRHFLLQRCDEDDVL